jgi:hypothetical protein
MGDRLVPSATFHEFNNTPNHVVVVTAANHQNNTITVSNDGDGNLRITADGVTRNFTAVNNVFVNAGDGTDTVTYNQGTSAHSANLTRDLFVHVDLSSNASGVDRFTANVFGNVGFVQDGEVQKRTLGFIVNGGGGRDRIAINANHDTDVLAGSTLFLRANGGDANDQITVDYAGDLDGTLDLIAAGEGGNDVVAVNARLDAGSSGRVVSTDDDGHLGSALVRGDLGNDSVTFAVRVAAGATAGVDAVLDGGFGFFLDNDTGRHTANVRTAFLEHDLVIV